MITKAFIILLPVCAMLIIALWKIDERVLRLEAIVKCLESETRALRRKIVKEMEQEKRKVRKMTYEERIEVLKDTAMRNDILIFPEIQAVFACLCSAATDYHDAANVNSVRLISEFTGLTKYRVRKVINCLRDLGLVERTTCGFPAYEWSSENGKDFTESHPPVNGFGLTKKGFESATYKKADELQEAEYRRWAEMSEEEILKEMEQEDTK